MKTNYKKLAEDFIVCYGRLTQKNKANGVINKNLLELKYRDYYDDGVRDRLIASYSEYKNLIITSSDDLHRHISFS